MTSPDASLIREFLGPDGPPFELLGEVDSTNTWLLERPASDALAVPHAVLATRQRAGRGRRGRSWLAEPGRSLALSLAFESAGPAPSPGLSIAVGCEVAQALSQHCQGLKLKWPNDLLRAGGKCGGILIESRSVRPGGQARLRVVVGVGINLLAPLDPQALIAQSATGVFDRDLPVSVEQIVAELVRAIARACSVHDREGLTPYLAVWRQLDAWHGQMVELSEAGQIISHGLSLGIDASGALRLQSDAGEQRIMAGDLSLRARAEQP